MRPKKVILCVDDNEQELSVLTFMLTINGYKVFSATTGQEAIAIFAETQFDLVLSDFGMPQMNGGASEADRSACPDAAVGRSPEDERRDPRRRRGSGQEELFDAGVAGAGQSDERSQTRPAQGHDTDATGGRTGGGLLKEQSPECR